MDAREALIQRIVDEGCTGCTGHHTGSYPVGHPHAGEFVYACDLDEFKHCINCDCWSHIASRALDQWEKERKAVQVILAG